MPNRYWNSVLTYHMLVCYLPPGKGDIPDFTADD